MPDQVSIQMSISRRTHELLEVLTHIEFAHDGDVTGVILELIDHAQQGVYRPGSWERQWLIQCFGTDWIGHLEQTPGTPFQRPIGSDLDAEVHRYMGKGEVK